MTLALIKPLSQLTTTQVQMRHLLSVLVDQRPLALKLIAHLPPSWSAWRQLRERSYPVTTEKKFDNIQCLSVRRSVCVRVGVWACVCPCVSVSVCASACV